MSADAQRGEAGPVDLAAGPDAPPVEAGPLAAVAGALWRGVTYAARTVGVPAGVRGLAVELAYTAVHLSLYPWGLVDEVLRPAGTFVHHRTDALSPSQRSLVVSDMDASTTPVLLVHGIVDNRSIFALLARPAAPARVRRRARRQLQRAHRVHRRHPRRRARARPPRRAHLREHRRRPRPHRRPLAGRADGALLRPAARRRRARRHARHPRARRTAAASSRTSCRRRRCRSSCAPARTSSASSRSRRPGAAPTSSPCGASRTS